MNILDCIQYVESAWNMVSQNTFNKAWKAVWPKLFEGTKIDQQEIESREPLVHNKDEESLIRDGSFVLKKVSIVSEFGSLSVDEIRSLLVKLDGRDVIVNNSSDENEEDVGEEELIIDGEVEISNSNDLYKAPLFGFFNDHCSYQKQNCVWAVDPQMID